DWAKSEAKCPFDRKPFSAVKKVDALYGSIVEILPVPEDELQYDVILFVYDESGSDFFDSEDADSDVIGSVHVDSADTDSDDVDSDDIESDDSNEVALSELSEIQCTLKEMLSDLLELSGSEIVFVQYLYAKQNALKSNLRRLFRR
ncbi:hypothetical protein ACTXT7_016485, partial [Hymenolepis weldensis]